jgi:hypothetical protein
VYRMRLRSLTIRLVKRTPTIRRSSYQPTTSVYKGIGVAPPRESHDPRPTNEVQSSSPLPQKKFGYGSGVAQVLLRPPKRSSIPAADLLLLMLV